jgi:Mrp family chromosome partitioning ATPase
VLIVASPESAMASVADRGAGPGLAELLRGEVALDDVLVDDAPGGIQMIGPGRDTHGLSALLQSARLPELLTRLRECMLSVVVETPSLPASAPAQSLASAADTVVVVAERRATKTGHLAAADRLGRHMGAAIAGVVLVDHERSIRHPLHGFRLRRHRAFATTDSIGADGEAGPASPADAGVAVSDPDARNGSHNGSHNGRRAESAADHPDLPAVARSE